ncbi:MAG: hypothetical protein R2781_12225 [Flavobacteriaceae bacterium]
MIKKILFLFSTITLLLSCSNASKKTECAGAWIGGKIVNPKLDYVVISHNRDLIDTVALDANDSFLLKVDNVDPGVYFFSHFEYQALFLEPGDSVMIYVNTIEFDESLSYSGRGAEKNNFLMELYLLNEELDDDMLAYYAMDPKEFESKMDSITFSRKKVLKDFTDNVPSSKVFHETAKAAITYSIYSLKELYISANSKKKLYDESIDIPESFYRYRDSVDYGNESLRNYYPYYRFLGNYLDNLSFTHYKNQEPFDRFSFTHNIHKINLIDSLITNTSLKNTLSRNSAVRYLLNGKNKEEELKMLAAFKKINTDTGDIAEIEKLAYTTIQLTPGNLIPNVVLVSTDNTSKDLHSIINKPTVLFFWSGESVKHFKKIHTKAAELRAKYPEYHFIGINIDNHFKKWVRVVESTGYFSQFEYQFENFADAEKKLLVNYANKSIIVDKDYKILDGNSNIFSTSIEEQLLGYLNK